LNADGNDDCVVNLPDIVFIQDLQDMQVLAVEWLEEYP
jgi:hypothetical protein